MAGSSASLHYAFGGGLGHLTRTLALRHTLGLQGPVATLCSSPAAAAPWFADTLRPRIAPPSLQHSREGLRDWIGFHLQECRPREIYVDAFPGGLLGELCDFPWPEDVDLILIARILKWRGYLASLSGNLPRFDRILTTETLPMDQIRWLETLSDTLIPIALRDPPWEAEGGFGRRCEAIKKRWAAEARPVWLIVHSGPDRETRELFEYALACADAEPVEAPDARPVRFVVATQGRPTGIERCHEFLDIHPVHPLFASADRIFTAGGCNTMRETAPWRAKHKTLPFPRKFDDQFLRVSQRT